MLNKGHLCFGTFHIRRLASSGVTRNDPSLDLKMWSDRERKELKVILLKWWFLCSASSCASHLPGELGEGASPSLFLDLPHKRWICWQVKQPSMETVNILTIYQTSHTNSEHFNNLSSIPYKRWNFWPLERPPKQTVNMFTSLKKKPTMQTVDILQLKKPPTQTVNILTS